MAEKLSITIFLEGAAEIEQQLEGIGAAGTKAFTEIGAAAEKVGGFDKLDPAAVTAKLEQFGVKGKAAIDKITTAVAQAGRLERIVGGVRQVEAGFEGISAAATTMSQRVTGAFTAVATAAASTGGAVGRVARSLGLLGSGAIVGSLGAAALAMEKAADSARILEGNLQALFRNAQAGTQFFNQIQNAAQTAGSSLQGTAKTMLDITNAFRAASQARGFRFAPGEELKQASKDAAQLFEILQQGMKLSGARAEEANKDISALFNEISKSGQVSGDTLRKLQAQFPQLGNALAKALGAPGQSLDQLADRIDRGLARIDFQKFSRAIKSIGPEIQTLSNAFDPTLAQRMDTIAGAWNRLLNSFGKSPAGAAIKGFMDDIAKGLDEIAKKQEQVGKFTVDKPPETTTGKFFDQMFQEFNQNIEIAKQNWETLKGNLSDPIKLSILFANLNPAVLAINKVIEGIQQLKAQTRDKITVPFEADPEPAWVQAYLGFIENVKDKFRNMFKVETEGPPQQPAWVEAYLGWIAKVKLAFLDMFTKRPEVGGQLGGGAVPLLGRDFLPDSPLSENIEDRRGVDTTAINIALAELATAAQEATQSLQGLQGLEFSSIATAADSLNTAISSLTDSMQSLSFSGMSEAFAAVTAAALQLGIDLQNIGLSEVAVAMQAVVLAANSAAQALSNVRAQGGGGGLAHGGLLGGRGTGTSDSNLAWVSRGEYIVPARVVRQPGVLALLEALRGSGRSRQKNGLPAYQEGGSVGEDRRVAALVRTVSAAIDRIVQLLDEAAARSFQGTITLIQRLNDLSIGIQTGGTQTVNQIAQQAQALINTVNQGTGSFTNAIVQMGELVKQNSNQMVESFKAAAVALRQLQSRISGAASGGLLGGRGTGTSDSNLVRVSRGEYIVPARAVRQPGVLAFLEALRHSGGSLRDVLDDMGRFALGGLVPRQIPAFAAGGLADLRPASGGRPIALTINAGGERQIFQVWADEKVADSVLRYATKRQVASAGRKSGAFG